MKATASALALSAGLFALGLVPAQAQEGQPEIVVVTGSRIPVDPLTLSQQGGEAGGSLSREAPVRVRAAPTKPGRVSTARWRGSGERDQKAYEQEPVIKLRKRGTGSNLADTGRDAVRGHPCRVADSVAG